MSLLLMVVLWQVNPLIQEMVGNVSSDSILSNIQRLQDFVDRSWWSDSCHTTAQWIYNRFIDYGLDTVYHDTIAWPPPVPPNIVGIIRGTIYPDSVYLALCAHFDAINETTPEPLAPGADDNASGVAAVLEAARILKNYQFEYDIRFIATSAEEGMLLGSSYYAFRADERGDDIVAVFNADMIGYVDIQPESLEVCGDTFCEPLVDYFIACSDTYTTTYTRKRLGYQVGDGSAFAHYGWLTISLIEDCLPNNNPYRHSPADTIGAGFNDLQFCTNSIKSIIAALASRSRPSSICESNNSCWNMCHLIVKPNPVMHDGLIGFSIAKNGIVRIKLYNIAGQLTREIFNNYKLAGNYHIFLDTYGLNQGAYILVMETNGDKITKSIIVVK
jgi:hypothetical protein